jgi:hypothetical protein
MAYLGTFSTCIGITQQKTHLSKRGIYLSSLGDTNMLVFVAVGR